MSFQKSLLQYLKKHIFLVLFVLLVFVSSTLLALLPPMLLKKLVDETIENGIEESILVLSLLYVMAYFLMYLCDFLKQSCLIRVGQGVCKSLRKDMLTKLHRFSYEQFTSFDSGQIEAYFSNDVDGINNLISSGVLSMMFDLGKIVGILFSLFVLSPLVGGTSLLLLPILILFTSWIRKKMFLAQVKNKNLEGDVNHLVLESVDNIKTIQASRSFKYVENRYFDVLKQHYTTNQNANLYDSFFSPVIQILKYGVIVSVMILTFQQQSKLGISIGTLLAIIDLFSSLFVPIDSLGMELQSIQKSIASVKRINTYFTFKEDAIKEASIQDKTSFVLKFEHVSFSYDGKEEVIHDFSYTLKDQDKLTLKGKSGAGKSTLFKLAYGLITPSKGRVTLNGVDTYLLSIEEKSQLFGMVYQDYFFNHGSIYEEVCLQKKYGDEKVKEVLRSCGLNTINDIHQKMDVDAFSTGELVMFNIVRAILQDNPILFLDEMNAKIDQLTAHHIMEVINTFGKKKMILSINHYGELLQDSKILYLE